LKKIIVALLAAVAVVSTGFSACAAANKPEGKVSAYYFHGNSRCYTCTEMEKYIRAAVAENFKDVLRSGKFEFKAVNVEEAGNDHFIKDYQLYTKSLILSLTKNGKEVKFKNLTKIWEYVRNKQRFFDYVTSETRAFLEEAK